MQGCVKKINQNQKKNDTYKNKNCGKMCEFEGSCRKSGETYQDDILKDDLPQH